MKKLSTKEFINRARETHGARYIYTSTVYINTRSKVKIVCKKHGEFLQRPQDHLRGTGCPNCCNNKKQSADEFIEKAQKIHGDRYDYSLVEYKNNYTKIKILCKKHGIFEVTPSNHLNPRSKCPKCPRLNTENFIKKAHKKHGSIYSYNLIDYTGCRNKIKIICKKHGVFEQTPMDHLSGCGCPKCSKNYTLSNEEFVKRALKVHGRKYDYSLSRYLKNNIKIKIMCKKHGMFKQTPGAHLKGQGCPECKKLDLHEFIARAGIKHNWAYDYSLVKYVNSHTKIKIICKKHGIFKQAPKGHLTGYGCPLCNRSKGEIRIEKFLVKKGIDFIPQHTFKDCRNKLPLPFDFYLRDHKTCIEYDGELHFKLYGKIKDKKKAQKILDAQKKNDRIKTEYCKNNSIKLIRIPYTKKEETEKIILLELCV